MQLIVLVKTLRALLPLYGLWAAIVSTVVVLILAPNEAEAAVPTFTDCGRLLSGNQARSSFTPSGRTVETVGPVQTLQPIELFNGSRSQLEAALELIQTPEQAILFWQKIKRSIQANSQLENQILRTLALLDFAKPLVRTRAATSATQQSILFEVFNGIAPMYHGYWGKLIRPAMIVFRPELVEDYFEYEDIHQYAEDLAEQKFPIEFNYATVTALKSLPDNQRRKMQDYYRGIYFHLRENPPLNKITRRNVEVLFKALFEDEFQDLLRPLRDKRSIRASALIQLVNQYWSSMGLGTDYSFQQAIEAAIEIQNKFSLHLSAGRTVYLYGSFPNGKAVFPNSDIDVHLDKVLERQYIATFGEGETFAKLASEASGSAEAMSFQKMLIDLEKNLARLMSVRRQFLFMSGYTPSKLLTIATGRPLFGPQEPFTPELMQQFNPIMLEITQDRIVLRIFDAYGTKRLYQIDIDLNG